jgi:GT2 family glycosyltransferase/MoaA/NifB/PqqE/SkfB family radical SAM enzyme
MGEHMPFALFESILRQLNNPQTLRLNYSGESTVYPDLLPAIALSHSAGARVELVTALASAPESLITALASSSLNRLTISLHAASDAPYREIYRYGSFEALASRLALLSSHPGGPTLDLAFVAMDRNLSELLPVAKLAHAHSIREITLFPVIRRDEIPIQFPLELTATGQFHPEFQRRLQTAVAAARQSFPDISFAIANPAFDSPVKTLGQVPVPFPGPLPDGAQIHTCEQNPWETAHILSNGDVVACEVLDHVPLGNLAAQSMADIWHGEKYRQFRQSYRKGEIPECRTCVWKTAFHPGPLSPDILGSRGRNAQLLHGWHAPSGEAHIWSSQHALAVLAPRPQSHSLRISGTLPPGPAGYPNQLHIGCNGREIGILTNASTELCPFDLDLPASGSGPGPWMVSFQTNHPYRPDLNPSSVNPSADHRDLGFALTLLSSRPVYRKPAPSDDDALTLLHILLRSLDLAGPALGRFFPHREAALVSTDYAPGISVVIPERGNPAELALCLDSVQAAARRLHDELREEVDIHVIVNGEPRSTYESLITGFPNALWQFHEQALGFAEAIDAGLAAARFDWVYLLNSDATLEPDAFTAAARLRGPSVFAIASQIFLRDSTVFRDETNLTALLLEDGLATIHDLIPGADTPVDGFYAGGGASLFRTALLRHVLDPAAYSPFYWEDVEWGWRARKLGFRCLFCPGSIAHHSRRSTISRYYSAEDIDQVLQRNRLLFHLRNLTSVVSLRRILEEIRRSPMPVVKHLVSLSTLGKILRGRIWNYRAPRPDAEVFPQPSSR